MSRSGGFWLGCFACWNPPIGEVRLVGSSKGTPIVLERAICAEHWAAIVSLELPFVFADRDVLLRAELSMPFDGF